MFYVSVLVDSESGCCTYQHKSSHKENAEALLFSIMQMQADFICRVSHPEPGIPAKQYFKTLRETFTAQTGELIDQINNL